MSKTSGSAVIRLRGVRQNNLKHLDLDLPLRELIVITGLSGSGKSSLAFDTLYAEGQRRYIETFSPYARQFFDRMDRPQVDSIQGIPPAIAIEQRNAVKTTRSTVGTMTEICDHMKIVWAQLSQLHCRQCGEPVRKETPQKVWETLRETADRQPAPSTEAIITFDLALSQKLALSESLDLIARQGYQRLLIRSQDRSPEVIRLDEALPQLESSAPATLAVVQDRIRLSAPVRARFIEACEQAYHFGKGRLSVWLGDPASEQRFSRHLHCARCDLEYREPSAAAFSFNHPVGACPTCRGFGRTISIDYDLAIPNRSLSLAGGAVKPWQTGHGLESQNDLLTFCKRRRVPVDVPFDELAPAWQDWVLNGDPDYGKDTAHEWPNAWYGVKGYFRWLESKAYKMHVRVLLAKYRVYRTCPDCHGRRFQPESLLYRVPGFDGSGITLADFYGLTVRDALRFADLLIARRKGAPPSDPLAIVLGEVRSRLHYLVEVGLGYLSLERPTRTLSGGETERVNLTTCLGSRLVNTLFVLDEPTVGLHPRDTSKLVSILERLRDASNTVVVVEHEALVMRAADQIIDLGPGQGEAGGELVFQGPYRAILNAENSITGQYLSGRRTIDLAEHRPAPAKWLRLSNVSCHNLREFTVHIPLERLVCLTGVSGSGKTTLMRDALLPILQTELETRRRQTDRQAQPPTHSGRSGEIAETDPAGEPAERRERNRVRLKGAEHLGQAILVDQSAIGRTPRSNPAVYIGAFDDIRELFAQSAPARQRGLKASAFSFNSALGQCESCRGAGFEKIEMQFLSDVYVRCSECQGRRYRRHILEVTLSPETMSPETTAAQSSRAVGAVPPAAHTVWSVADLLEATIDQAIGFLAGFPGARVAAAAAERLRLLQEVGLGYLRLGQPINTLSGGESQRLKLIRYLADFVAAGQEKSTLFMFDEPTTGLHFHDVEILLRVFQRLVRSGHSVLVIEHNLDVIRSADWVIDLGPEAGAEGGRIVAQGPPDAIAQCAASHTGYWLKMQNAE